jgi:pimeloyl-ACP methyl ester carboxylesterase
VPSKLDRVKPTVVFLHGMARTHRSMSLLRRHVERAGYPTWSQSYPSRRRSIDELGAWVADRIRHDVPEGEIVAVTHSMGGIVVRHIADRLPWCGVVMLAPPNRGSRVAGAVRDNPMFQWYFGPAGQELPDPAGWPAPPTPFAVIAGTCNASAFAPPGLVVRAAGVMPPDEASDGIVTVAETRLEGMHDFATVDASHTWIMNHPEARAMVLAYLAGGKLRPGPGAGPGDC